MTVRIDALRFESTDDTYLSVNGSEMEVTYSEHFRRYILSMVRHIMRDRGDCNIIPVVLMATARAEHNEFGHNFSVEVEYSRFGYRAIYAGRIGFDGLTHVSCYAD